MLHCTVGELSENYYSNFHWLILDDVFALQFPQKKKKKKTNCSKIGWDETIKITAHSGIVVVFVPGELTIFIHNPSIKSINLSSKYLDNKFNNFNYSPFMWFHLTIEANSNFIYNYESPKKKKKSNKKGDDKH